jgi:hypothetical protein
VLLQTLGISEVICEEVFVKETKVLLQKSTTIYTLREKEVRHN